jgi:hypothetical protein
MEIAYFRPEKATKSAKIALSHTYVVPLLQKKLFALKNTQVQDASTAGKKKLKN